jgi:hypothetical protein
MNKKAQGILGLHRFGLGQTWAKMRGQSLDIVLHEDSKRVLLFMNAAGDYPEEEVNALVTQFKITTRWEAWWIPRKVTYRYVVKLLSKHRVPFKTHSRTTQAYEIWNQYVTEEAASFEEAVYLYMEEVRALRVENQH